MESALTLEKVKNLSASQVDEPPHAMKLFHCFVQTYIQTPLRFVRKEDDDKEEETARVERKKKSGL